MKKFEIIRKYENGTGVKEIKLKKNMIGFEHFTNIASCVKII